MGLKPMHVTNPNELDTPDRNEHGFAYETGNTGGVGLIATGDITLDSPEYLMRDSVKNPEVIQTLTGIEPLTRDVHTVHDETAVPHFVEDKQVAHGLHNLAHENDGVWVKVRAASRIRTRSILGAPATAVSGVLLHKDNRRLRTRLTFFSTTATDVCYLAQNFADAIPGIGFRIPQGIMIEIASCDQLCFGLPATNAGTSTVSVLVEVLEDEHDQ